MQVWLSSRSYQAFFRDAAVLSLNQGALIRREGSSQIVNQAQNKIQYQYNLLN